MLCNRNLAANINAVSEYVKLSTDDMLFSILPLHHTYESTIGFLLPFAVGASVAICEGLRYIISGRRQTPDLYEITKLLGKERLLSRINNYKKDQM